MNQPKYFVRPDDGEVFSQNGNTLYSTVIGKQQFPDHIHSEHTEGTLRLHGFIVCENDADLEAYQKGNK